MPTLTIDYVLEGRQRGYQFTSPVAGIAPDALKRIWRSAMPRGQGWGNPVYRAARSLKCFTVDETGAGLVAACEVHLTDQVDEVGRTGIRKAHIDLHTFAEHRAYLLERLAALPAHITAEAERRLYSREWELLFRKHHDQNGWDGLFKPRTLLAYDYAPDTWSFVEACLLILVTRATLLTNLIELTPKVNPFADQWLSFTTLALDPADDARLIGIPADTPALRRVPHIDLR
ncbi:MAG: hypothetical protein SF162_09985 [bacterium]|nr:hypothetical protein [bacterium]